METVTSAEFPTFWDHPAGVQASCEKYSRGESSHTYAWPLTTRPREKNVSRYGERWGEWEEEEE